MKEAIKEIQIEKDVNICLLNFSSIKPLDEISLNHVLVNSSKLFVVEKHSPYGGLYSAITEYAFTTKNTNVIVENYPNTEWVGQSGTPDDLIRHYGYDKKSIKSYILNSVR